MSILRLGVDGVVGMEWMGLNGNLRCEIGRVGGNPWCGSLEWAVQLKKSIAATACV